MLAIKIVAEGECNVSCPYAVEYKPVCTSEGRYFGNMEAFECYKLQNPYGSE